MAAKLGKTAHEKCGNNLLRMTYDTYRSEIWKAFAILKQHHLNSDCLDGLRSLSFYKNSVLCNKEYYNMITDNKECKFISPASVNQYSGIFMAF